MAQRLTGNLPGGQRPLAIGWALPRQPSPSIVKKIGLIAV
jgi:hypothetical protein